MAKATKASAQKRVDDLLRIRLDGAEWWDIREYVREKEAEPGSNWHRAEAEEPISESQIRRYLQRADDLVMKSHQRSRKRLFRRHLAQRRHLYSKAVNAGDIRVALSCLQDEAKMLGLYPAEPKKERGEPPFYLPLQQPLVAEEED